MDNESNFEEFWRNFFLHYPLISKVQMPPMTVAKMYVNLYEEYI